MLAAMMASVQSPWHERCNAVVFIVIIMSVAGLERMTTESVVKRLTLSRYTSR